MQIHQAHWRVPSEERAFEEWLEGAPTPAQRETRLAEVRAERDAWVPSRAAHEQLHELQAFVGKRVRVQFWDPIMAMLDDEGPFPLVADCRDIATMVEGGFKQAYLLLDNIVEQPDGYGYSPARFLKRYPDTHLARAPISELFEIDIVAQ